MWQHILWLFLQRVPTLHFLYVSLESRRQTNPTIEGQHDDAYHKKTTENQCIDIGAPNKTFGERWNLQRLADWLGPWDHGRTSFQADHRSAGFSLPWWRWFFQRCWPAPVSASLAIYTNLSHLFSKGVHTAGEESGLSGELLSCKWQLEGLQKGGSKMSLVKINTKLLPLGLFQGIVMFLFHFFTQKMTYFGGFPCWKDWRFLYMR